MISFNPMFDGLSLMDVTGTGGAWAGIASWMEMTLLVDGGRGTGLKTTECKEEAGSGVGGTPPILLDSWMIIDDMPPWLATLPPIKMVEGTLWCRT